MTKKKTNPNNLKKSPIKARRSNDKRTYFYYKTSIKMFYYLKKMGVLVHGFHHCRVRGRSDVQPYPHMQRDHFHVSNLYDTQVIRDQPYHFTKAQPLEVFYYLKE